MKVGVWLTDTTKGRNRSHNWSLQAWMGKSIIYSACGLFGDQKDLITKDMKRCKRCKLILRAHRRQYADYIHC